METINSTAIESATIKLAAMDDLPQLKSVYKDIISTMNQHKIQIWEMQDRSGSLMLEMKMESMNVC